MVESIMFLEILAQGQGPSAPPAANPLLQMLPLILLFLGMWFLIIAPQRKRQKQHDAMIKALQRGDEVMTNGGIYGEITSVKDDRFVIKIAENTKVEIGKPFVQTKLNSGKESESK